MQESHIIGADYEKMNANSPQIDTPFYAPTEATSALTVYKH